MKVFFVGSPRALKDNKKELHKIYRTIESLGHDNLFDFLVSIDPETFYDKSEQEIGAHFSRTLNALQAADVIIIEASIHSLSMGYLARMGEELDKPVIIMHLPNHKPFFFLGNRDERFFVIEYTYATIEKVLKEVFEYATNALDVRFNLFLPPALHSYLKLMAKKKGVSKSLFVRQLLQDHHNSHTV